MDPALPAYCVVIFGSCEWSCYGAAMGGVFVYYMCVCLNVLEAELKRTSSGASGWHVRRNTCDFSLWSCKWSPPQRERERQTEQPSLLGTCRPDEPRHHVQRVSLSAGNTVQMLYLLRNSSIPLKVKKVSIHIKN